MIAAATAPRPLAPIASGLLYYPGVRCPSCGGRHFAVGRVSAECALCLGALILSNPSDEGTPS